MKTGIQIAGAVLPILVLAAVVAGCEDTMNMVARTDASMVLTANPSTVILDANALDAPRDPETGLLMGTSGLSAQVFNKAGYPLEGVAVFFSTSGGRLGSQGPPGAPPTPITTDVNGLALDTLTLIERDADSVTVTAQSSSLSKTATITKQTRACTPPTVNAGPDVSQVGGVICTDVTLSGTITGTEPSGSSIQYQWTCGNGTDPDPLTGPVVNCCYEQSTTPYTATFTVTITRNPSSRGCTATASDTVSVHIQ